MDVITSANAEIWQSAKENNVSISELAQAYRCSESALLRQLRVTLTTSTKEDVLLKISSIAARKERNK